MSEKLQCVVPFCPRTRGLRRGETTLEGMRWICRDHSMMADRRLRIVFRAARRRDEKNGELWPHIDLAAAGRPEAKCFCTSCCFVRLAANATEVAMGISGGKPARRKR